MSRAAFLTPLLLAGCVATPRFMREVDSSVELPPRDPELATVVLFRNGQPCETGGSYVVVTGEGRFLANLASGTRAEVRMAPGEHLIAAWNPRREADVGLNAPQDVAAMPVHLWPGRVYFVHLAFTPDQSLATVIPPPMFRYRRVSQFPDCRGLYRSMELVPIAPDSFRWAQIQEWYEETLNVAPDASSGQEFLDAAPGELAEHLDIAVRRLQRMSDEELELRTMSPEMGATP